MVNKKKTILIIGAAGFVAYHFIDFLLKLPTENFNIIGMDNYYNNYDVKLKRKRIKLLEKTSIKFNSNFIFIGCF